MVIAGAKAEMTMNRGTSKATVLGGGIGAPSGGYANEIEMAEAMADPRYSTDEVYRKQVATKLSLTTKYYEIKTPIMGVFLYLSNI